jgi:hypothetical protein
MIRPLPLISKVALKIVFYQIRDHLISCDLKKIIVSLFFYNEFVHFHPKVAATSLFGIA